MGLMQLNAELIYVKAGSNGNGSSWDNAFGNLQDALKVAKAKDQIWVAAGKYVPSTINDRDASFNVPDKVVLLGGFAGDETTADQRNWSLNTTILSGEIGSTSIDDNSYTVVYTQNVSKETIIDGFVITAGTANGTGSEGDIRRCGAGLYNNGTKGTSNPTVLNCIFTNNYGRDGAAIYNYALNGKCNPTIKNCEFVANRADLDGGAIYNDGNNGTCSPKIENCIFENNEATYGAGILNRGSNGVSKPVIMNCIFVANLSYIRGSGIYNNRQGRGICDPIVRGCRYEENRASVGRAISNSTVSSDQSRGASNGKAGY